MLAIKLWEAAVLLTLFVNTISLFAVIYLFASKDPALDGNERCQDYHSDCKSLAVNSSAAEMPNCNEEFYQDKCPMTCGKCGKNYYKTLIEKNTDAIKSLEKTVCRKLFEASSFNQDEKQITVQKTIKESVYFEYESEHLHDGKPATCYASTTTFGTNWVALVLPRIYRITKVEIDMNHSYPEHLEGSSLRICSDETMEKCFAFATINTNGQKNVEVTPSEDEPIDGKVVRIDRNKGGHLMMCEVVIFGKKSYLDLQNAC